MNKSKKRRIVGFIFRAWRYSKDGTQLWAKDYGLKAWKIPIYEKE